MQTRLATKKKVRYNYGPYNKSNKTEQWIRITEGCPHNCPFCYEPQEFKVFEIPEIIRNDVKIMDMNLLSKKQAMEIIKELGKKKVNGRVVHYELICGIDYRFLTQEIANALKKSRFRNIRLAWDWYLEQQYKMKDAIKMLLRAGYKQRDIMVFMLCNWKVSFAICDMKLDLLKVWGVKVSDCYFDNQLPPNIIPIHWTKAQIKCFRQKCALHNHAVNFGLYADLKRAERFAKNRDLH